MKASNDLFLLIKSLSKNEKGYFKKYASRHATEEGNNYLFLFNAIDHFDEYDEAGIKKKLGLKKTHHFPSDKNYLYRLVMRSLNEYYHGNSVDREIRELLNSVEILFAKALYHQCEKLLNKAEALADKNEKFLLHLEIIDWKLNCKTTSAKIEDLDPTINNNKQRTELIKKYKNLSEYRLIESDLFYYVKTFGYPRTRSEISWYEKTINDPLLKNNDKALSFWAKFHYYNIFNFYYDVIHDKKQLYTFRKKLVEFAESNPDMINDNQIRFLVALNNLLNIQDELGKDEEVKATLEKIRSIRSKSTDIQMRVFTFTYTIEFTRLIIRGDFEKCISLRPEVEEGLIKFGNKINHEYLLALRFNLFYAYFGVGDFNESLKWLNKIVNDWHVELRKDVYSFIRIINLIIHLELGNADLLSYEIQSAKRFFKKEERLFRFETIILAFIEEISIINNRTSRTNAFKKLKTTLRQLQTDHHESQIMEFFDFDSWIESKLQGKSFRQIIQNNFKH